jgi:glutamate racemase
MRFARGPLTAEQRAVLEAGVDRLYRTTSVPPGVDLAAVCAALQALVGRHEALRTRFPAGDREQVVDGAGLLPIEMYGDVEEARAALTAEPFDIVGEWGIRVGVVRRGDEPRSVVLCLSRLAVDARSANQVADDLCALLRGADPLSRPLRPLDGSS